MVKKRLTIDPGDLTSTVLNRLYINFTLYRLYYAINDKIDRCKAKNIRQYDPCSRILYLLLHVGVSNVQIILHNNCSIDFALTIGAIDYTVCIAYTV